MKIVWAVLLGAAAAWPQDGAALFRQACGDCHRPGGAPRAPLPEALAAMTPASILRSMESGSMRDHAARLTATERDALARHVGKGKLDSTTGYCTAEVRSRTDSSFWNGWGANVGNTRSQTARMAGLTAASIPRLRLKWAFGHPGVAAAYGQPSIVGGRVYLGSQSGAVYALDLATGCTYWSYQAEAAVRGAPTIAAVRAGRYAVLFGDVKANVYAVDAHSAALLWKTRVDEHPAARITGSVVLWEARLYIPVSSIEEASARDPAYPCCTFRGSVAALDAESGRTLWKTYAIPVAPAPLRKAANGTQLHGPAGAAVWSAPAIDAGGRRIYAATGNGYIEPAAPTVNSILAIDMDSGGVVWSTPLGAGDAWTFDCLNRNRSSCAAEAGPDFDIGASPVLARTAEGKRILLAGQKSGIVSALDPEARGRILWQTRVGKGSLLGGVMFGLAADESVVYAGNSDLPSPAPGGLFALRLRDGARIWQAPSAAILAAVTAVPGAVFSASMDGRIRAHASGDGRLLWEFETKRDFETVNGVKARGGSVSGGGPVAANGMLLVNSGYGVLGGSPGNVTLAFGLD